MAAGDMKYWVFHQEALQAALQEYFRQRVLEGGSEDVVQGEVDTVRGFLLSPQAAKLRGGRAG